MKTYTIKMIWDKSIWIARCEDLGITLEAGSFDALIERVKIAAPEMSELNHNHTGEIELNFVTQRKDMLRTTA